MGSAETLAMPAVLDSGPASMVNVASASGTPGSSSTGDLCRVADPTAPTAPPPPRPRAVVKIVSLDPLLAAWVTAFMRASDRAEMLPLIPDGVTLEQRLGQHVAAASWGYVGLADGLPAAVMIVNLMWPGCCVLGFWATDAWPKVAWAFSMHGRRHFLPMMDRLGLNRGEVRVPAWARHSQRWIEGLGARREALLADHGRDREPFYLYAWTRTAAYGPPSASPGPATPQPAPQPEGDPSMCFAGGAPSMPESPHVNAPDTEASRRAAEAEVQRLRALREAGGGETNKSGGGEAGATLGGEGGSTASAAKTTLGGAR